MLLLRHYAKLSPVASVAVLPLTLDAAMYDALRRLLEALIQSVSMKFFEMESETFLNLLHKIFLFPMLETSKISES